MARLVFLYVWYVYIVLIAEEEDPMEDNTKIAAR